jgi:integrase
MNVTITVKHNRKNDNRIELIVYQNKTRKRTYFSTNLTCAAKDWNDDKKTIKGSKEENVNKNVILNKIQQDLYNLSLDQFLNNRHVDLQKLRDSFDKMHVKNDMQQFSTYLKHCLYEGALKNMSSNTKKNYTTLYNKWLEAGFEKVRIDEVTPLQLDKFDAFLIGFKQSHNTRWGHFKFIKRIMTIAIRDEIIKQDYFPFGEGKFRIKYMTPQKIALTLEELKMIEETEVDERLKPIKDMFLLSCYTGLRFSDVNRLCSEMIRISSGEKYLVITSAKTSKPNNIPINSLFKGKPSVLVDKYMLQYEDKVSSFKWFDYTNQYVNRELKTLQRWSKVATPLTMHIARHSCCTFLVADFKIKPSIAQQILGHSNLKQTEQYLHVRGSHIEDSLKDVDWG